MPRRLKNLRIDEVSSVDRGAGEGVNVVLMKRHSDVHKKPVSKYTFDTSEVRDSHGRWADEAGYSGKTSDDPEKERERRLAAVGHRAADLADRLDAAGKRFGKNDDAFEDEPYTSVEKRNLPLSVVHYLKRQYSAKERKAKAKNGHAMPNGGFPIEDREDVENAVQAIGRAKDRSAAISHIKRRAKAVGAGDAIPEKWGKRVAKEGAFDGENAKELATKGKAEGDKHLSAAKKAAAQGGLFGNVKAGVNRAAAHFYYNGSRYWANRANGIPPYEGEAADNFHGAIADLQKRFDGLVEMTDRLVIKGLEDQEYFADRRVIKDWSDAARAAALEARQASAANVVAANSHLDAARDSLWRRVSDPTFHSDQISLHQDAADAHTRAAAILSDAASRYESAARTGGATFGKRGPRVDFMKALHALAVSMASVLTDKEIEPVEKIAALEEREADFHSYLDEAGLPAKQENGDMPTIFELSKKFDQQVAAHLAKTAPELTAIKKALDDAISAAVAKMSSSHKNYFEKLDGDEAKKFAAMGHDERTKYVKDHPHDDEEDEDGEDDGKDGEDDDEGQDEGEDDDKTEKALAKKFGARQAAEIMKTLPRKGPKDPATKRLAKRLGDENAELRKSVEKLEAKEQKAEFKKRAVEIGLPEKDGDLLLKAHRGDPEALAEIEKKIQALTTQVQKAGLFSEIGGHGQGGGVTAYDQLVEKASAIRKAAPTDKPLTAEQAFEKAMKENPDLAKQERDERHQRVQRVAA